MMNNLFFRIVFLEFKKVKRQFLFLAPLLICVIFPIISFLDFTISVPKLVDGYYVPQIKDPLKYYIWSNLFFLVFWFQFILLPIIVGCYYSVENQNYSWKQLLIMPIKRQYFITAKIICSLVYLLIICFVCILLIWTFLEILHILNPTFYIIKNHSYYILLFFKIFLMFFLYCLGTIGLLHFFYILFNRISIVFILNPTIIFLALTIGDKFDINSPTYFLTKLLRYISKGLKEGNDLTFNVEQIWMNILMLLILTLLGLFWVKRKNFK